MGYDTQFEGRVKIEPPLSGDHLIYINLFNQTRRMKRDATKAEALKCPARTRVKLPIGVEGGYYVSNDGDMGQSRDPSILDYNEPPEGQPGLWCKWEVTDDGEYLQHDGAEKFYDYTEWMRYLIDHFFKPWGYNLNGRIRWQGEEIGDVGEIIVKDNVVTTGTGAISDRIDGDDVRTDKGFDQFLDDMKEHLQTVWEERGGPELGGVETDLLGNTLYHFFHEQLNR